MLRSLLCCFSYKSNIPAIIPANIPANIPAIIPVNIALTPQSDRRKIEDICVSITDSESSSSNSLYLFDTKSLFDSNNWLNKLDNPIGWKDCLPFVPPIDRGVVIKVYDGDTITIASKLPYPDSPLYRFSVRLNGIDCPEIKGNDKYEKECAQLAKQEITDLILNKIVILKNVETEKYGRILADVYIGELHLNTHLLKKRLAVAYDGGTKISPKNWMDYYSKGEL
jgi:endonuclease YncB( thermonuclease family)